MGKINIIELDHIVLNVGDIDRSLKFYTEVLGLKGERVDEFRAGKVSFPSVRITDQTIIDLFPVKIAPAIQLGAGREKSQSLLLGGWRRQFLRDRRLLGGKSRAGAPRAGVALGRAGASDVGLFFRSRWQRD
jgi:catechol 2,3-dioxygenase-like lactoylglutathione lyase family enzyme